MSLKPHIGVLVLTLIFQSMHGLNLDPRFSVIKTGPDGSYFGFSLAQHQVTVEDSSPPLVTSNLLVVGAPKKEMTIPGKGTFGGALYRCRMDSTARCTYITQGVYDTASSKDEVDDRWLGVTVASQGMGGKVVCCGHRYIKANAALGLCYLFSQKLDDSQLSMPCYGLPHRQYLQDFGLCQAGMSANFGQDYSVIMGAPGSVFWKGVVFVANTSDALGVTWEETPSPFVDPEAVSAGEQAAPTEPYSYNGYSSTSGKFDATKQLIYVSGAPMSDNNGEVVLFRHPKEQEFLRYAKNSILRGPVAFSGFGASLLAMDVNNDGFDDLFIGAPYFFSKKIGGAFYVYLGGPTMISKDSNFTEVLSRTMSDTECQELQCENARFGISLTTLGDINMDGYHDFAVGAPYEGNGAVYIYLGDDSKAGFNVEYAQRIVAEDMPGPGSVMKSFGYALSGGLDLDENGYPDLAVGAYESNKVALIRARPIIKLNPNITVDPMFVDLESPVGCTTKKSTRQCITITLCVTFTTTPEDSILTSPRVNYRLEAEMHRKNARVEMDGAIDSGKRVVEGKNMVLEAGKSTCITQVAFVKDKMDIDDKLNAMQFSFSFDLEIDENFLEPFPRSGIQDINQFPVLSTSGSKEGQTNTVDVQTDFVKECGPDNKCLSNLQFEASFVNITKTDDGYEMVINEDETILNLAYEVYNLNESAYQTIVYLKKIEGITFDGVEPENNWMSCLDVVTSDFIICSNVGNPLRPNNVVNFMIRLKVNKELAESNDYYPIQTWVETLSTDITPLNDNTTLNLKVINKADIYMGFNVDPDEPIICQGEARGGTAFKDEIGIGAAVKHTYSVRNKGPGHVAESYLTILWPYEVADPSGGSGKYLLYPMRRPVVTSSPGTSVECNDAEIEKYINPLKIEEVSPTDPRLAKSQAPPDDADDVTVDEVKPLTDGGLSSRRRRDAPRARRATTGAVIMSCQDSSARCFKYACKIGKLEPQSDFVRVVMDSRLWESTLLTDYRDASNVQISSWGNVTIAKRLKITQDKTNDFKKAVTEAVPDYEKKSSQDVQWWIILVALLVGLLILALVIFVLYKFGFFKRKRQEDMRMYKAEKKQQAMLSDYDEDG